MTTVSNKHQATSKQLAIYLFFFINKSLKQQAKKKKASSIKQRAAGDST